MYWPWMTTRLTRPASTASMNLLKLTSGSRGCCLVTMDHRRSPISRRRSQSPKLREMGFNRASVQEKFALAIVTYGLRSSNVQPPLRSSDGLENTLDDAAGVGAERGACAARQAGRPQDLTASCQHGDSRTGLARHLGVDQHVLQLAGADARDAEAVAGRRRANDERAGQRVGVEEGVVSVGRTVLARASRPGRREGEPPAPRRVHDRAARRDRRDESPRRGRTP